MPPGRICTGEGCETRLSVYNHGERCSVCAAGRPDTVALMDR